MTLYAGSVSGSAATTGGRVSLSTGYSSTSTSGGMALRTANAGAVGASGGIVMSTGQAGNGVRCVKNYFFCCSAAQHFLFFRIQWLDLFWHRKCQSYEWFGVHKNWGGNWRQQVLAFRFLCTWRGNYDLPFRLDSPTRVKKWFGLDRLRKVCRRCRWCRICIRGVRHHRCGRTAGVVRRNRRGGDGWRGKLEDQYYPS